MDDSTILLARTSPNPIANLLSPKRSQNLAHDDLPWESQIEISPEDEMDIQSQLRYLEEREEDRRDYWNLGNLGFAC